MNILSVELTHDEAKDIIAQFVAQIETFSICQLDVLAHGTEFEVSTEQVDFVAQVEFFTEYDEYEAPDCPTLIAQSVSCKMKAYNKQGTEIQFKTESKRCEMKPAIDIAQEIENHFTV